VKDEQLIKDLASSFNKATRDISDYDDFIKSWKTFVSSKSQNDSWEHADHKLIERFSISALSRLVDIDDENQTEVFSHPKYDAIQGSAITCDERGIITSVNTQALKQYPIAIGENIESLNFRLEKSQTLNEKINELLKNTTEESELTFLQVFTSDEENMFPVAIMPMGEKPESHVLIIILDNACSEDTLKFFTGKYGLTEAESDVVGAFANGVGLKKIATLRKRSYITIRNQFQAILEKTGCSTQIDLLRMLLSISYLLSFASMLSDENKNLNEIKIIVKRPHNRQVDVNLYGDPNGKPIVVLPSLFGMPITKDIENLLKENSILMIGLWRPGFANTSDVIFGENLYQCLADDIAAVLDQRGIEKCPLLARASAARSAFNLANLIPDRLSKICIANTLVPAPYLSGHKKISRWTEALISASKISPSFATLMLKTGKYLMVRQGAKKLIENMYKNSEVDQKAVADIDIANSIFNGAILSSNQGYDAAARDMIDGFEDWSDEVIASEVSIKLLHGSNDPQVPIGAVRAFAEDNPNTIELIEFASGGGLLNYTHTQEILESVLLETRLSKN